MKKDYRSILYGFTMAEILISLAIAMIVATAMVPVFGTKKVKRPTNKIDHGVAACYYNANNQLQFEIQKNTEDGAAREGNADGGTECAFTIPSKASHIKIIAIGAGGSALDNYFQMQVVPGANSGSGSIRIDNNFQDDIEAASSVDASIPNKIRNTFNEWATRNPGQVYALYNEVRSPIGAGGSGIGRCGRRRSPSSARSNIRLRTRRRLSCRATGFFTSTKGCLTPNERCSRWFFRQMNDFIML